MIFVNVLVLLQKLKMPIEIATKKAKGEIEMHPVTAEAKISKYSINSKPHKLIWASYSLNRFVLFLQ